MGSSSFVVEGVAINCDALISTAQHISSDCSTGPSFSVFTLNLDHLVKLRRDPAFRAAYGNARYVTADGFPIVLAARLTGVDIDRVTGSDLIVPLCAAAAEAGHSVYLFGSSFKSLAGAARHLKAQLPSLEIAGASAPESDFDPTSGRAARHLRQIAESGAKICFVALGAPKQELFAASALGQTTGIAFVCIGAGLDFLAGTQKRAPRWAQAVGGEWLWRLASNPARFGRRYLDCLIVLPSLLLPSLVAQRSSWPSRDR